MILDTPEEIRERAEELEERIEALKEKRSALLDELSNMEYNFAHGDGDCPKCGWNDKKKSGRFGRVYDMVCKNCGYSTTGTD